MGYTAAVTFADGNNLDADDVKANQKQARDFWNEGIRTADIPNASVTWQELQKGDFRIMTNDYAFMSGEVSTNTKTQASRYNDVRNAYYTCHIKNTNFISRILERTILPNTGKSFTMEKAGEAIIEICLDINIPGDNYYRELLSGVPVTTQSYYGETSTPASYPHFKEDRFYLYVDGSEQTHSLCASFPEDSLETSTPSTYSLNPEGFHKCNKRMVSLTVLVKNLTQGTHTFDIRVDAYSEVAYVGAVSTSIETFYLD